MSCIENIAAISLVVEFKLLMNINEWTAHVQFKNLPLLLVDRTGAYVM